MRNCENCYACCVGDIELFEEDSLYGDKRYTNRIQCDLYDCVMKVDNENFCIALDKDKKKCSIYEKRPQVCRDFRSGSSCCKEFVRQIKKQHKCIKCSL